MKNIYFLLGILTLFISCSTEESSLDEITINHIAASADSSILREYHELRPNGDIKFKAKFDSQGRLSEILKSGLSTKFTYGANDWIINITEEGLDAGSNNAQDILYDSQDRVLSIGDRTFDYDPIGDFYTEDIIYNYTTEKLLEKLNRIIPKLKGNIWDVLG